MPYFVFETLLALFRTASGTRTSAVLYVSPHWPMWYLTALFLWRLATPLLTPAAARRVAGGAVAVSLVGGLNTATALDLPRTFGLLPFFVAGLL